MDATQLEKAQESLKARISSPAGRSESVRVVKGMKQAKARITLKQELKAAKKYRRILRYQKIKIQGS